MCLSHKKVSIIGLGDILGGDMGVPCQILDMLSQDPFMDRINIVYAGDDPRYAGGWIYDADLLIIIASFPLGGPPGWVDKWDYYVFNRYIPWLAQEYAPLRWLIEALGRTELAGGSPKELLFIRIEPQSTQGYGLSIAVRKAAWKVTALIKQELFKRSLLPECALRITTISGQRRYESSI